MFKKNIAVVQSRPLSGKDGKKLRKDLERLYPGLSDDDHKRLFASKAEVNLLKLSNRVQVYAKAGGNPLFFDPTGRDDILIPTVYALWLCPKLIPTLYTYSEVSPKVSLAGMPRNSFPENPACSSVPSGPCCMHSSCCYRS